MAKTEIEITPAERKKIEVLLREAKISAMVLRKVGVGTAAQNLDDLADVAEQYLKEIKCPRK